MGEGTEETTLRRARRRAAARGTPHGCRRPPAQGDVTAAENEESMARTKNNQRSASRVAVDVGATGTNPVSKMTVTILALCVIAAIWAVSMLTPPGRVGYYYFFIYAEYYMGVIALVALSITIMVGLVATDRLGVCCR